MTAPRLTWGPRPRDLQCSCGRKPLCGFTTADGKTFHCACCYDDGTDHSPRGGGGRVAPYFRSPEERAAILRGSR